MYRFLHRILLVLVFICWYAATAQEVVTDVACVVSGPSPRAEELQSIAEKLITIKINQPFSRAAQRESVDALTMCRLFETVKVDNASGKVTFRLTPARYVRDIHYWQEYPLFRDDVEKVLSTYPGDIFTDSLTSQQKSLVYSLYKREGFIKPWVGVSAHDHPTGSDQIVLVHVHPGEYYRLDALTIQGNSATSDVALKLKMKTWRLSFFPGSAGRFVETTLREDVKTLVKYYQSRKFADVKIRDSVITNRTAKTVSVILSVEEGDHYAVKISKQPTPALSLRALKKEIVLYKNGNRNNIGVRKTVKAVERYLHESGFLGAQTRVSDTTVTRRQHSDRLVQIAVEQGRRTTVSSITFTGASRITKEVLLGQMLLVDKGNDRQRAFSPDRLNEDVFALQMLYRSYGYLKATVTSDVKIDKGDAAITLHIAEGLQTRIGTVSFDSTLTSGVDVRPLITIKHGDPYRSDRLKHDALAIQSTIAETGHPQVTVTPVVTMNGDSSSADVAFNISEGKQVTLGDVHYIGAFRTKEKILNREFRGLPGKPLSLKEIVNAQKGVRDMGLFSSVRFRTIGLREKKDTVHLFVEVTEKRPYYGAVGGGYQSDKGVFINSKAGDRNMLGLNKEVWLGGELSRQFNNNNNKFVLEADSFDFRLEAGMIDPRLLGSHVRSQTELFTERVSPRNQNFRSRAYGITNVLTISPEKHLTLGMGSGYVKRRQFMSDGTTVVSDNRSGTERPRNIVTITPSAVLDKRDSFTRPRKGFFISSSIDLSKSIDKGNMLDNFMKVRYEMKDYRTPYAFLTFASVLRGGYILPFGGSLPADQLFYLGGTGDVRGFAQNLLHPVEDSTISAGNAASLSASIEARIDAGFNIEIALFTDVGRLEQQFWPLSAHQFRPSAGAGIRYLTPIGPVGILYGRKLTHEKGDLSKGAFHFSLGYTF